MKTDIRSKLASQIGTRSEQPNIELANMICQNEDYASIQELFSYIEHDKNSVGHDAIKVIYEIARLNPSLMAPHLPLLFLLLEHKSNRIRWGTMIALFNLRIVCQDKIFENLEKIMHAVDEGSVITTDHAVKIMASLAINPNYRDVCNELLLEICWKSPVNQFPNYVERTFTYLSPQQGARLENCIKERMHEFHHPNRIRRLQLVLKKIKSRSAR